MSSGAGDGAKAFRSNLVLIAKRLERGWSSRKKAARELHALGRAEGLPGLPDLASIEKALYRHETGRVQVRDEIYRSLYCLAYEASPHELFGAIEHSASVGESAVIRSHKFIAAFVGSDAVASLAAVLDHGRPEEDAPLGQIETPFGSCHLHAWPFGAVVYHLVEEMAFPSIASLAVWRQDSYLENLRWVTEHLRAYPFMKSAAASYVLSLYWVESAVWPGDSLDTALRLLCMPRVLLERTEDDGASSRAHAELVEQALMVSGFDHPEMIPFGVAGISAGYASWSGVVYYPLAPHRALAEAELVAYELAAQSVWVYCEYLNGEIEQGRDPVVPAEYGWRFLRAARSRLTNARARETGQHRSMRNAIVETSGLVGHLGQAIEALRELDGG